MARNAAAVLLLAVSIYAAAGATVGPLTTAVLQETDGAGAEETSSLLPVHRDSHEEEEEEEDIEAGRPRGATAGDAASLASAADEEGKEAGSDWHKPKKLDDDVKNDSDSDSDEDSGSDSESGSDSDSDSDSGGSSDGDDPNRFPVPPNNHTPNSNSVQLPSASNNSHLQPLNRACSGSGPSVNVAPLLSCPTSVDVRVAHLWVEIMVHGRSAEVGSYHVPMASLW